MSKEKDTHQNLIEIFSQVDLHVGNLELTQAGEGEQLVIWDPALDNGMGGERRGRVFVSMPDSLAQALPGSELSPEEFLQALNVDDVDGVKSTRLTGDHVWSEGNPAFHIETEEFALTVFYGQINQMIMRMSELATIPEEQRTDENRGEYQRNLFELLAPMIQIISECDLALRDDCLASADSIIGTLAALARLGKIKLSGKRLRVDVAVATHQGILLLRQFAKQNEFFLDLYVGSTADALSKGEPCEDQSVNKHENYIEYSQARQIGWGNNIIQVVGDMGNFLKSMLAKYDYLYPWNKFRVNDGHGSRGEPAPITIDWDKFPYALYLTNGGFGIKAFYDLLQAEGNPVVFSAKRVNARDYGYGVLLDGI